MDNFWFIVLGTYCRYRYEHRGRIAMSENMMELLRRGLIVSISQDTFSESFKVNLIHKSVKKKEFLDCVSTRFNTIAGTVPEERIIVFG